MKAHEEQYIKHEVKNAVMPDIKGMIPGLVGFILRTIFPKIEKKIIEHIIRMVEFIIAWQKLPKEGE